MIAQLDFEPEQKGVPPGGWQSAAIIELLTGVDETALRNLARTKKTDGQPWVPSPVRGRWPLADTVRGVCEWLRHRAEKREQHPFYASQAEAESLGLIPRELMKYARTKGIEFHDAANRVNSEPLRRFSFDLLKKMLSSEGGAKTLEGFEELDLNLQRARVAKEDADERERNNRLANRLVHDQAALEEALWEEWLEPFRSELISLVRRLRKSERNQTPVPVADLLAELQGMMRTLYRRALGRLRKLLEETPPEQLDRRLELQEMLDRWTRQDEKAAKWLM